MMVTRLRWMGAEVGVLEEPDEVGLRRLLEGQHRVALEPEVRLEVLGDLAYEALERQLTDQELRALLVLADLTECHRPRPVTVGLLHAASRRRRLPRRLGGELLPGGLAAGGLCALSASYGPSPLLDFPLLELERCFCGFGGTHNSKLMRKRRQLFCTNLSYERNLVRRMGTPWRRSPYSESY